MKQAAPLISICMLAGSPPALAAAFDRSYAAWDAILKANVVVQDGGKVTRFRYAAVKKDPAGLEAVLKDLSAVPQANFDALAPKEKLAFLINSYNAFTVSLIVRNFPVASIKKLGSLFKSPWKISFFSLLGAERTLDEVEHVLIRKAFDEPRIHFAVNCAAKGCPPLRQEAFVAERLDAQLEDSARLFITNAAENRYDAGAGKVYLSSIFKWYGDDFSKSHGSAQAYVAKHIEAPEPIKAALRKDNASVSYLDYDWDLNGAP